MHHFKMQYSFNPTSAALLHLVRTLNLKIRHKLKFCLTADINDIKFKNTTRFLMKSLLIIYLDLRKIASWIWQVLILQDEKLACQVWWAPGKSREFIISYVVGRSCKIPGNSPGFFENLI